MPCDLCQRVAELEDRADTHTFAVSFLTVVVALLAVALIRSGALPRPSWLAAVA